MVAASYGSSRGSDAIAFNGIPRGLAEEKIWRLQTEYVC